MRHAALIALLSTSLAATSHARSAVRPPADVASADALAATPPSEARDGALKRWAQRADLTELIYVLRRPAEELRGAEAPLLEAALARAAPSRAALRLRLAARLRERDPDRARHVAKDVPSATGGLDPDASVYRVAALLPDSGSYADYGRAVLQGIRAGLARPLPPGGVTAEVWARSTGEDAPRELLAAFDAAAARCGAAIGELLSVPTLVLATAARYAGLPLISPTATDESVGQVSNSVFQIGPSGEARGRELARAALRDPRPRVGILVSGAVEDSPFTRGFKAAAESLGATVVLDESYAEGSANFKDDVRDVTTRKVELLFWDGDAREAESILRQLARDRVSVRICGGEGLAPERHHPETRALLEGVIYAGEDWRLADSLETRLAAADSGGAGAPGLRTRGYLAGAAIASAIAAGALCPEEITAYLSERSRPASPSSGRGFIDASALGARLAIYAVRRGRAVPAQ